MNINLLAPINQLGYGITGLNILKSLNEDNNVSLFVIGQPQVTNQDDANIVSQCMKNAQLFDTNAPCIKIWHQHDMAQFAGKGKRIGFPIFELDKFNDLEKHHLKSLDKIFVCSEWAKKIILNKTNIENSNITVIPLGVDSHIFRSSEMPTNVPTRFFNCGKWEIRKGHDILVNIFNDAFNEDDDVELLMMCENPFCTEQEQSEWINLYKKSKLGSKIHIIPRQNTQQEVYSIMSKTHCGIFPARAEGWNLELLEMMACGKHVIATDYSAHTEFCNSNNTLLIPIKETETAYDGKWFHGQGNWAKIDNSAIECTIEHMRQVHTLNKNNQLSINEHGVQTAQKFTWANSGRNILNVI